jgi:hypothetical protein
MALCFFITDFGSRQVHSTWLESIHGVLYFFVYGLRLLMNLSQHFHRISGLMIRLLRILCTPISTSTPASTGVRLLFDSVTWLVLLLSLHYWSERSTLSEGRRFILTPVLPGINRPTCSSQGARPCSYPSLLPPQSA